ncbi:MAG: DUF1883 domain-containing protein [Acidimicrobiaceae bacterium]|nr:DUF1883 domain-containing protein [Acidimicrobiaceae bacterium]
MGEFIHSDLGFRDSGDVVVVTLSGSAANVRLLDSFNFSQYQSGQQHHYFGGLAQQSPVRIPIPHSGIWHAVVDMQGLSGSVNAGFRVIPAEALRPLPPIQQSPVPSAASYTLQDVVDNAAALSPVDATADYDIFISHATEDKDAVARPLAAALDARGVTVWYDEFELRIGDSLRRKIDAGIAGSRFGLVVLSHAFFDKGWAQYELDGLVTRTVGGDQVLLPVWHEISKDEVGARSPSLADRVALKTSDYTIDEIADQIAEVVTDSRQPESDRALR